jgi:hypothetical protein
MALTVEQHSQIATAYDKAAADQMVPSPQRAAFARKAEWFRLLARVAARKKAKAAPKKEQPELPEDLRPLAENVMKRAGP